MGKSFTIAVFSASEKNRILDLLSDAELPVEDLTNAKLKNFLIAKGRDGAVIGVVGVEMYGNNGLLRSLTVRPSHRGIGIGHQLTREIESFAWRNGIRTLYLLTMTAAEFFPKLGYEVTQRDKVPKKIRETEEFQNVCPDSAVCLLKVLDVK